MHAQAQQLRQLKQAIRQLERHGSGRNIEMRRKYNSMLFQYLHHRRQTALHGGCWWLGDKEQQTDAEQTDAEQADAEQAPRSLVSDEAQEILEQINNFGVQKSGKTRTELLPTIHAEHKQIMEEVEELTSDEEKKELKDQLQKKCEEILKENKHATNICADELDLKDRFRQITLFPKP